MVNTRVRNPEHRRINRKLDRQKKARMRLNEKMLSNPRDPVRAALVQSHNRTIANLKMSREKYTQTQNAEKADAVSADQEDWLVGLFRNAYRSLNRDMEQGLVDTVTGVFAKLVKSFSDEQRESASSSLGRLLSNLQSRLNSID